MNFKERTKPTTIVKALPIAIPYIIISNEALSKMFHYVDKCADEIGWLGTAYRDGNQISIMDTYLFHQEAHAATTEITPEGLADFAGLLMLQEDGVEIWNNMKMWGHSHVNMGVTPSAQDDKQMEAFMEGGHDWFIRLIANKKGDLKIDLYDYSQGVIYTDLPWYKEESTEEMNIQAQINELERQLELLQSTYTIVHDASIDAEIKEKVKKKTYVYTQGSNYANKQKSGVTTTPTHTKSGTTSTTDTVSAGTKKKLTEDETEENNVRLLKSGLDWFQSDDEVRDEYSVTELAVFSYAKTLVELDDLLIEAGDNRTFTDDDLERIMRVAKKTYWAIGGM